MFPQAIGLAATWDTDFILRVATAISDEARAKYHEFLRRGKHDIYQGLTFWTPNINLFRDPRWGRGMETYGEDPYLTGRMAVAVHQGMQGDDPKYLQSGRHSQTFRGSQRSGTPRHTFDAVVSEKDLRETYLPHSRPPSRRAAPFRHVRLQPCRRPARVRQSAAARRILRKQWGFKATWFPTAARSETFI